MQITKHKVVAIDYTLTDNDGAVLDSSKDREPLTYLHGERNIIPGLENQLEGKSIGDQFQVAIPPSEAYGEHDPRLRQVVSRANFENSEDLQIGMQFQVSGDQQQVVVTIVKVTDDEVTVDGNHALAGKTLNFDVTVREIRDATSEEISHGHAHGPGGHSH